METFNDRRLEDRSKLSTEENQLRRLLRLNEMSVSDFSREMNIDRTTLYKWKQSGNFPQWPFLYLRQRLRLRQMEEELRHLKVKDCHLCERMATSDVDHQQPTCQIEIRSPMQQNVKSQ